MSDGMNGGKGRLKEEIELLRREVSELERLYKKGGVTTVPRPQPKEPVRHEPEHAPAPGTFHPFFPNHLFKEAVVAFIALLVLIGAASLFPAPLEEVAKPTATDYVPRPEWYFLSVFQILKYFPGNLEVIGIIVVPTLLGAFLLLLPFIDRNPARRPGKRPLATFAMSTAMAAVLVLTVLAATEKSPIQTATAAAPPAPKPAPVGSVVYTKNCYNCHGLNFRPAGDHTSLLRAISEGVQARGMPAFGGVLTDDEMHATIDYVLSSQGAKLFAGFCAGCHGTGVDTAKAAAELRVYITEGNPAKGMPGYGRMLIADEIANLSEYISSGEGKGSPPPEQASTAGSALYLKYCASCHGAKGDQIPKADLSSKAFRDRHDEASTRNIIANGTPSGMPGFGEGKGGSLTEQQIAELAKFLRFWEGIPGSLPAQGGAAADATSAGKDLYSQSCATCHGAKGDQLPNAKLNAKDFLTGRGEAALVSAVAEGKGGMPPMGKAKGGALSDDQVKAIVSYLLKSAGVQ